MTAAKKQCAVYKCLAEKKYYYVFLCDAIHYIVSYLLLIKYTS